MTVYSDLSQLSQFGTQFQACKTQGDLDALVGSWRGKRFTLFDHAMVDENNKSDLQSVITQVDFDLPRNHISLNGTRYDGKTWYFGMETYDAKSISKALSDDVKLSPDQVKKVMAQMQQGVFAETARLIGPFIHDKLNIATRMDLQPLVIKVNTNSPDIISVSAEKKYQTYNTSGNEGNPKAIHLFQTRVDLVIPKDPEQPSTGSWSWEVL